MLLVLCALMVKALVPAGYMIGPSTKLFTVQICSDSTGKRMTGEIEIPMEKGSRGQSGDHTKAAAGCAFSALSLAGVAGADAIQLILAFAFILLLGFAAIAIPAPERRAYLRPPLRGPPLRA